MLKALSRWMASEVKEGDEYPTTAPWLHWAILSEPLTGVSKLPLGY